MRKPKIEQTTHWQNFIDIYLKGKKWEKIGDFCEVIKTEQISILQISSKKWVYFYEDLNSIGICSKILSTGWLDNAL